MRASFLEKCSSPLGVRIAVAVQASVLRTKLAGLFKPRSKLPPRAMQADLLVRAGNSNLPRNQLGGVSIEVRELEHFRVFRTHRGQEAADALAGRLLNVSFSFPVNRELFGKARHGFRLSYASAVQVGQHISEDAIKPRKQVLVV